MDSDDEFAFLGKDSEFRDVDELSNPELVFSTTSASSVISSGQNSPRGHSDWPHTPITVDE